MEDTGSDQKNHDAAFVDDADYGQSSAQTTSQPKTQSPPQAQTSSQTQQTQQPKQQQQQTTTATTGSTDERCNLIINYIPMSYNEDRLKALFAPYGTIESCKLMIDKSTSSFFFFSFLSKNLFF